MTTLQDHLNLDPAYNLVKPHLGKPATFKSNSTESSFQKRIAAIKTTTTDTIVYVLAGIQLLLLFNDLNKLSFRIGIRTLGVVVLIGMSLMELFIQQKKGKSRNRQNISRKSSRSADELEYTAHILKVIILMSIQELAVFEHSNQVYYWISSFMLSSVLHLSTLENLTKDKKLIQIRSLIQLVCLIIDAFFYTWQMSLLVAFRMMISYVGLLNIQLIANKWARVFHMNTDSVKKWSDQLNTILDELPYQLFIVSMKDIQTVSGDISQKPFVKIAFFNYAADSLLKLIDPEDSTEYVNFLDLIAKEDSMTLMDESYKLTQGEITKARFTTEIPREVFKDSEQPSSYKYDVTMWKCKWHDEEAMAVVFNNDAYVSSKVNRFAAKYLKGLDFMLSHCESEIEGMTRQLNKYYSRQIDQRKLIEHANITTINMWSIKYLSQNFVLFEDLKEEFTNKNFRMKTLLVNLVDWAAKDFCGKGITVGLTFTSNYPFIVKSKLSLIKALFFNLLKYIELNMNAGSINIHCESETVVDHTREEFEKALQLQFKFTVTAPEGCPFPSTDFFGKEAQDMKRDFLIRDDMNELLMMWLARIKTALELSVQFSNVQSYGRKLDR